MKALTPQEALEIYHSGAEAVVKVLCELSAHVERLENRIKELELIITRPNAMSVWSS